MSDDFIKFGFSGGVFSEQLYGRTDLDKYSQGLRQAENWIVDPSGSASTRASFSFADYIDDQGLPVLLQPFQFNRSISNSYIIVFQQGKIRFVQDRAYLLEPAKAIIAIAADGTFTSPAHGFSVGDWVKFSGNVPFVRLTFAVTAVSPDTFLVTRVDGAALDVSTLGYSGSGAFVSRIYTIPSIYAAVDFAGISFSQDKDVLEILHQNYAPRILTRYDQTNWVLSKTNYAPSIVGPASINIIPSTAATAGVGYAVTAVSVYGEESPILAMSLTETSVNITVTAGSVKLTWPASVGASYYKIYRTVFTVLGADISFSELFGYIGQAFGTQFIDVNIIPDFSLTPPRIGNPFDGGQITYISITNGGSGYSKLTATVSASGGGTGFVGKPIVNAAGEIIGVFILNPGLNYATPTFTFGGGTGATAVGTAGIVEGNSPVCSWRFQQRRIYAGSINQPMAIYGSAVGFPHNFQTSFLAKDSDAFTEILDTARVTPIKALYPFIDGLLVFTDNTVWQVTSPSGAVSGGNIAALPITITGIANLPPLAIDNEMLFLSDHYCEVEALKHNYTPGSSRLSVTPLSIYSPDFFSFINPIQSWTYVQNNNRLIWAQRADGTLLSCTYQPLQNVYAWTNHSTQGLVVNIASVLESNFTRLYAVVRRLINGVWRCFLEYQRFRIPTELEQAWALDCALSSSFTFPVGGVLISASSGTVVVTSTGYTFTSADIGKHFRAGFGKGSVVSILSPSTVSVVLDYPIANLIPQTNIPKPVKQGAWSLTKPFTVFRGLDHLEGMTVSIVADGGQVADAVVVNGTITLDYPASNVAVGLPFNATLQTLPFSMPAQIVENKHKRIVGVNLRLANSRGVWVGDADRQYEIKDRHTESLNLPSDFLRGFYHTTVGSSFEPDNSIIVQKRSPFHITVTGIVTETELGED